jgi:hypothetical protein
MKKQNLDQRTSGKGKEEKKKTWMTQAYKRRNNVIRGLSLSPGDAI